MADRTPDRAPVVLLHDSLALRGGGEAVLDLFASRVNGDAVLACLFGPEGARTSDVVDLDYPPRLSLATAGGTLQAQRRLERLLGGAGRRACVAFTYPAAVRASLAALRGRCELAWVCQEDVAALLSRGRAWSRRAAFALIRRAGCRVGCLNENALAAFGALGFPPAQLFRLRQGVDVGRFRPAGDAERRALRARLGLPADGYVVTCVANLYPPKGHATLLGAAARCRAAGVPLTLALVGEAPPEAAAHAAALRARGGDWVKWAGHSKDVESWLGAADVAALASELEVAPLSLLEAAACGLPAVASDATGNREVVRDGHTGLLFPTGDVAACAAALERLARDPALARTMGQAARERALSEYDISRTVESFDRLIASVSGR